MNTTYLKASRPCSAGIIRVNGCGCARRRWDLGGGHRLVMDAFRYDDGRRTWTYAMYWDHPSAGVIRMPVAREQALSTLRRIVEGRHAS